MLVIACQALNYASLRSQLRSTGSWRLLIFAGDKGNRKSLNTGWESICSVSSLITLKQSESALEVLLIHASSRNSVELHGIPPILSKGVCENIFSHKRIKTPKLESCTAESIQTLALVITSSSIGFARVLYSC